MSVRVLSPQSVFTNEMTELTKTHEPLAKRDSGFCECSESCRCGTDPICLELTPEDLVRRMKLTCPFLLLDCRSFIAYNLCHIVGSLNISCADRFSKKRLVGGKARVGDLVSGIEKAKELYKDLWNADFVLYDDCCSSRSALDSSSPLKIVIEALAKEGKDTYILKGGLQAFRTEYEELCSHPSSPPPQRLLSPTTPLITDSIETTTATQILPYLYLGNERDAKDEDRLRELGITHILNVTANSTSDAQSIVYERLPASDDCHQNLSQYFEKANKFIDECKLSGGKVLVHCKAGVSRSATITTSYLMQTGLSMVQAYAFIKEKRKIVAPNFNFMGQLMELDQELAKLKITQQMGSTSISPSL